MGRLFADVRDPSTLGTFLRVFTFGHLRQLDAVAARFLACLARATPILGGADQVAYLHIDDTVRQTRSEEHTSELQSRENLVCRLLLEKKKKKKNNLRRVRKR